MNGEDEEMKERTRKKKYFFFLGILHAQVE